MTLMRPADPALAIPELFEELDPAPRLLMGPGPVDVNPRVLRAMAVPLQGQFDPQFTGYMNQTMALYRHVFRTRNPWTFLIDGTARAGIEACLVSLLAPGDRLLVPIFGRFGHLLVEIGERVGAAVSTIEAPWGTVFDPGRIEDAIRTHRPKVLAICQGDTSTTMLQPLDEIGAICRRHDVILYVDCTASLGGNPMEVDAWQIDITSAGLQKCLSGPPGSAPITFNDRVEAIVNARRHVEQGIRAPGQEEGEGPVIRSNYFDLAMLMDYWSPKRLNHHTEASSMLYAARECARVLLEEGIDASVARHELTSRALRAGLEAMGLALYGDPNHRMKNVTGVVIPDAIKNGEAVRKAMLEDFGIEIGTSFGPLAGKIWRIGTMGYVCRKPNVLRCLASLEQVLRRNGYVPPAGAGVDAAMGVYGG
ncbi:pyridoxal-phosphate-dependent aminotransferase family protein [Prosthecomicrobium sp. N25]|uniref:pyridoxal-phosphate-dependent aminotransferase family protein n=1 Tax=Prosthecomicrobium sp. N25 TaxID=3129254 RepID=UPI0030774161